MFGFERTPWLASLVKISRSLKGILKYLRAIFKNGQIIMFKNMAKYEYKIPSEGTERIGDVKVALSFVM